VMVWRSWRFAWGGHAFNLDSDKTNGSTLSCHRQDDIPPRSRRTPCA
jgi:hypothetical protein